MRLQFLETAWNNYSQLYCIERKINQLEKICVVFKKVGDFMALKKSDYPYFREIYPGSYSNCYTGSVSEVLKMYSNEIEEYVIYILGNGFQLFEKMDEFGDPKIYFELVKMVDIFCDKIGCSLEFEDVDHINTKKQVLDSLKNKNRINIIVWVNSKHLQYSDLYYSTSGYLHAIVLEKIINPELIRIRDGLIVSTPAVNCIADFHIDLLERSINDNLETPEVVDVMGKLIFLNINGDKIKKLDIPFLINKLYNDSIKIKDDFKDEDSVILRFYKRCATALAERDTIQKQSLFIRINKIIKALWVIPNRKLFYKILPDLNLNENDEKKLLQSLDNLLNEWMILATYCLKCSIQSEMDEDSLSYYFSKANQGEEIFWNNMVDVLGAYCK